MKGGLFQLPDDFGETNVRYVLRAADHWKPLVNAYSGFQTPLARDLHELLLAKKPTELLDALEAVPVSYVTVDRSLVPSIQRAPIEALISEGLASGRLRFVRRFRPGDDLFAVVRTEPDTRSLGPPPSSFSIASPASTGREDASLTGSIDVPGEGAAVTGPLRVSGWARIPGEVSSSPFHRRQQAFARDGKAPPEAGRLLRREELGDCSFAGYEGSFAFEPGDAGPHEIVVVFRSKDGRERHYSPRRFVWSP